MGRGSVQARMDRHEGISYFLEVVTVLVAGENRAPRPTKEEECTGVGSRSVPRARLLLCPDLLGYSDHCTFRNQSRQRLLFLYHRAAGLADDGCDWLKVEVAGQGCPAVVCRIDTDGCWSRED